MAGHRNLSKSEKLMREVSVALTRALPHLTFVLKSWPDRKRGLWRVALYAKSALSSGGREVCVVSRGEGRTRGSAWNSCLHDYCYCYSSVVPGFLKAKTRQDLELRLAVYGGS